MLLRFATVLERGKRRRKRLERGHRRADLNAGADVENRLALLPELYETLGHTLERLDRAHAARAAGATILERIRSIPALGAGKRGAVSIAARSRRRSDVKF